MDRRTRIDVLAVALLVLIAALALQAATAAPVKAGASGDADGAYPGDTLITVQSYIWFDRNNGEAFIVSPEGEVVWRFGPPNSRVFDAEALENGNILASVAEAVPNKACPPEFQDTPVAPDHCVHNRVVELDRDTGNVVWEYGWYDAFIYWHEVHDADRLPNGETAIIDMGNDRAFKVSPDGEVTWSWSAREHIGPGTAFWEAYVPADARAAYRSSGPESDWTHMNDVDLLPNGNLQLSIRNFDVVLQVDPSTNEIADVLGRPGSHSIMREQHDPNRLTGGTVLIADSQNDRVVEVDAETGDAVWVYDGGSDPLQWPRDADRLPNGNTLVVDSRNFRVQEVSPAGGVVWSYSLEQERGIVYDADRLGLPEELDDVPSAGTEGFSGEPTRGPLLGAVTTAVSWAGFVFPPWVGAPELLTILAGVAVGLWLAIDIALYLRGRR